ncbi:Uncharacterised protein [Mycobacteroides abscessus subsp. abscessus]|nr:Uncharacterised protein [Mycobacteroides abscessus subsp. abscessus]
MLHDGGTGKLRPAGSERAHGRAALDAQGVTARDHEVAVRVLRGHRGVAVDDDVGAPGGGIQAEVCFFGVDP